MLSHKHERHAVVWANLVTLVHRQQADGPLHCLTAWRAHYRGPGGLKAAGLAAARCCLTQHLPIVLSLRAPYVRSEIS